ncbi:hypothetical protein [Rhodopirellula sp. SWK7]|uniref:hypothetical protein n=1 Tax=Rhodopirellula sp. SWK7 TaxID=595460 RepID=UPI0002BF9255|nr:hypothetical protein [Rhodopirellula sp. SWK7]EMI40539.1 hypothetical protein RRSWK_06948 [Rhodopirellula sp. SWK7]
MAKEIVVSLTSDEERLLRGFRKVESEEKRMADGMGTVGKAGQRAGKDIADAMIKAGQDGSVSMQKLHREMRKHGSVGREVANGIEQDWRKQGKVGRESLEQLISKMRDVDAASAAVADDILKNLKRADSDQHFVNATRSLESLGPAGRKAAQEISQSMREADSRSEFAQTLRELRMLGPAGKEQARQLSAALKKADSQVEFDKALDELQQIGGEAAEVATGIQRDMKQAAIESAGDMNAILERIVALRPEAAQSAERIKREIAEAANSSAQKLEGPLSKLRAMGPVGQAVANRLKAELQGAGKDGAQSIDQVIDEIRKIDPEAGEAAEKLYRHIDKQSRRSGESFAMFGRNAVLQIGSIVTAYASVERAVDLIREASQKVLDTNKQIFEQLKGQGDGKAKLLQISTDANDFKSLTGKADQLAIDYGINRDVARNLVFSGRSEGFESQLDDIAAGSQVIDVESQATVAGQIPALFKENPLTPMQGINATLVAAQESRLSFSEIAGALPQAAEGGAIAKSDPSELIATLSVLAARFKSADTAADRIKAFATKVGLDEGVAATTDEAFSAKERTERKRVEKASQQLEDRKERVEWIQADLQEAKEQSKGSDSDERRIRSLERSLKTAMDAVEEFDRDKLEYKQPERTDGRESLAGIGIISAAKKLRDMNDDTRRDFLGDSQEVNAAYLMLIKELDAIEGRQRVVENAIKETGTSQSPLNQRKEIAAKDPRLEAVLEEAKSKNNLEINRENRRAVDEGRRAAKLADELSGLENEGVSSLEIAAAEIVAEKAAGLGIDDSAGIAQAVGSSPLGNLKRDLMLATARGDKDALALVTAVDELKTLRQDDADAIVSRESVARVASWQTGTRVNASQVSPEQQAILTREIDRQSREAVGSIRNLTLGIGQFFGGSSSSSFLVQMSNKLATDDGVDAADNILSRIRSDMETGFASRDSAPERISQPSNQNRLGVGDATNALVASERTESPSGRSESSEIRGLLSESVMLQRRQLEEAEKARKAAEDQREEERRRNSQPNRSRPPSPSDAQREAARRSVERSGGIR